MVNPSKIDVWRVALDGAQCGSETATLLYTVEQLVAWRAMLSVEEQTRSDAFHAEGHRRDYIVAHAALRNVLGKLLSADPASVLFAEGSFTQSGAPGPAEGRVKPTLQARDLRFNLSHTQGMALIAVGEGREVGVDVERIRPMDDLEEVARSVMSAEESEQWTRIPESDRSRAFYRLWTRKESYLKAIGLGLYRNLQDVTVPVSVNAMDVNLIHLAQDHAGEGSWQIRDLEVGPEYSASLTANGMEPFRLEIHDLDLSTQI
jgi:4'-phosphopantetheinyl transferase